MSMDETGESLYEPLPPGAVLAWFCVRSQPKHEHIAAAHLRQHCGLEVFLPRIRFKRQTRQGLAWVTEALFPNYLFARFHLRTHLRMVHHARGVSSVVHFGQQWPTVSDATMEELQQTVGEEQTYVISEAVQPGDEIQVAEGAFAGLQAVVTRALPGKQRIAVLLDFLGRQTMVELDRAQVLKDQQAYRRDGLNPGN